MAKKHKDNFDNGLISGTQNPDGTWALEVDMEALEQYNDTADWMVGKVMDNLFKCGIIDWSEDEKQEWAFERQALIDRGIDLDDDFKSGKSNETK